jgi:S1-C subfamily serine protease
VALLALTAACTADEEGSDTPAPSAAPAASEAGASGASSTTEARSGTEGQGTQRDQGSSGNASRSGGNGGAEIGFEDIPDLVEDVVGSVLSVQTPNGEGSGVVIGEDGMAVTNAHVVEQFPQVQVVTAAGERFPADVVGTDRYTDLALLHLSGGDLAPLPFAKELPRVGSLAIAIGNPLGFENTVSVGVVSGLERSIPGAGPSLVGLLQTDAAISPGNSGGALVGAGGEVIGINVAYIPPSTTGAVSIGFAIPSPVVLDVVQQLEAGGAVQHPFVGIQPEMVTGRVAQQLGLDQAEGVLVLAVVPSGPADQAGLQRGDVVLGFDDKDFESVSDFLLALRSYKPGDVVSARIVRQGQEQTIPLTLGSAPVTG